MGLSRQLLGLLGRLALLGLLNRWGLLGLLGRFALLGLLNRWVCWVCWAIWRCWVCWIGGVCWVCRAFCWVEVSKTSSSSSSPSSSPSSLRPWAGAFEIRWLLRNSPAPLAPLALRLLPRLVPLKLALSAESLYSSSDLRCFCLDLIVELQLFFVYRSLCKNKKWKKKFKNNKNATKNSCIEKKVKKLKNARTHVVEKKVENRRKTVKNYRKKSWRTQERV